MTHSLLLASQSPRRRELLSLLGLPFRVVVAHVPEQHLDESPAEMALRLARAKARAVAQANPGATVVGFDTLVSLTGEVLGKPADAAEARDMLLRLRARPHTVYTGLAVARDERETAMLVETEVLTRRYSDAEIETYVASGEPMDKAGAYAIQDAAFHPVLSWQGCYSNVMGLPLCHLAAALRAWGITPPRDVPAACQAHTGTTCTVWTAILGDAPPLESGLS